jgi:hypothetical protein
MPEPLTRSAECCWHGSYRSLTVVGDEPFVSLLQWRTAHVIPGRDLPDDRTEATGTGRQPVHQNVDLIVDEDHSNATIRLSCARVI